MAKMDYYEINNRNYIKEETRKDKFCTSGYGTTYRQIRWNKGAMEILSFTIVIDSNVTPPKMGDSWDRYFAKYEKPKFEVSEIIQRKGRSYTICCIVKTHSGFDYLISDGTTISESSIDSPQHKRYVVKQLVAKKDGDYKIEKSRHFVPSNLWGDKVTEYIANKLSVDVTEIEVSESRM